MKKNLGIAPCGVDCSTCTYECSGCRAVEGKIFWAKDIFEDALCPMYKCAVIENKFSDCGECEKMPCQIHYDCKDPSLSDEVHLESIRQRTEALKKRG